ncbi:MAG: A/G-specific adenine glycosylase [Bacteroidia bacterium]
MLAPLRNNLAEWYKENNRNLPWRENANAYRVWLSEIILQQTRVAQGTPYYEKFIEEFPDVFSLAAASEKQLLLLWQGLGYYTRARNLHRAAKLVSENFNGQFPESYAELRALPGVGDYTASAIASIAFGLPHAVVDGNVLRVLARLFGVEEAVDGPLGRKRCKELAQALLNPEQPGLHNQAVMELGALICKPRNPDCLNCPVKNYCHAYSFGRQTELPVKGKNRSIKERYFHYFLVRNGNRIMLRKRKGKDIWENLYDLPLIELPAPGMIRKAALKHYFMGQSFKFAASENLIHQLTHQRIQARFYEAKGPVEIPASSDIIWVAEDEIGHYPQPKLIQNFLKEKM